MPPIEQKTKMVTDLTLRSWLNAGSVDRSVGNSLMFVASEARARHQLSQTTAPTR